MESVRAYLVQQLEAAKGSLKSPRSREPGTALNRDQQDEAVPVEICSDGGI